MKELYIYLLEVITTTAILFVLFKVVEFFIKVGL